MWSRETRILPQARRLAKPKWKRNSSLTDEIGALVSVTPLLCPIIMPFHGRRVAMVLDGMFIWARSFLTNFLFSGLAAIFVFSPGSLWWS